MYRNSMYTITLFITHNWYLFFCALYSTSGLHDIINRFYYQNCSIFSMTSHSRSCCGVVSMKLNQEKRFWKCAKNFNFWIGTNCKQWFVVLFYRRMTWSRQTSTQSWLWVLIDTTPQVTRISPELKQYCLTLMLFLPIPCWFVSIYVCLSVFLCFPLIEGIIRMEV